MKQRPLPTVLVAVAALFILAGLGAVFDVLVSLAHSRISLNTGVLGLFVGVGLLRLQPGWRTCALVALWLTMILAPIAFMYVAGSSVPVHLVVFGEDVGDAPKSWFALPCILAFVMALWQYKVLTSPEISALFGTDDASPEQNH